MEIVGETIVKSVIVWREKLNVTSHYVKHAVSIQDTFQENVVLFVITVS